MIYVLLAAVLFILELCIKNYIAKTKRLGEDEPIIKDKLSVRYIQNRGAIYSTFEDKQKGVCITSCIVLIAGVIIYITTLMKRGNELLKLGLSLIVAGGASNVWDRIKRKYVVDYIYWKRLKKIIFNLADVMIALGSVLVLLHSFVSEK